MEKPEEKSVQQQHAVSMVQCKLIKQLELLKNKKFDDEDITEDIEFISEVLETSVQDLRLVQNHLLMLSYMCRHGYMSSFVS